MKSTAIVLANGNYQTIHGKTAHGLVRTSSRFHVLAIVDPDCAGEDAGEVLDGVRRDIPIMHSIREALTRFAERPEYCVVGMASHGGRFTSEIRALILEAAQAGLSIVNGLHDYASDDPDIAAAARERGVDIVDLRKPPPKHELHFWTGEIRNVRAPRIAVLGMDCAIGKRTTARLVVDALNAANIKAEMIYTGQTGWMQGAQYGFVFDSIINDYVCGELEHAIVSCDRGARPDVMIIEGQSSLRNPSGPCGAEFLLSGGARGVILQHAPDREFFEGYEEEGYHIPPVEDEIKPISF
ncbi:MAG: DUF1611 domain-containing protein, partial [Woeseiaceae bacterium]